MTGSPGENAAQPSRIAERLLARLVRGSVGGKYIVGDLREEYRVFVARRGRVVADTWYWAQVLGIGGRMVAEKFPKRETGRIESVIQDLRFALRHIRRNPAFAAVAVITLAVGIGSSVTMFGAMDALVLRPLPLPAAGRLVEIYGVNRERGWNYTGQSIPNLVDLRARSRTMHVAGFRSVGHTLSGVDLPERVAGYSVSWDFFKVLQIRPALGRSFAEHEQRIGAHRVAVISHGLWRRHFASDSEILERVLMLDGEAYAIIGVLGRDFWFRGQERDVWTPLVTTGAEDRGADVLHLLARLEPGATLERAREEASEIADALAMTYPETNRGWGAGVRSFREHVVPVELRSGSLVCLLAVAALLLIVCANVTNLLLSRVSGRTQEMAVRAAVGASRARLARHLLTEALVLSALGGVGGVLLAIWGIEGIVALLPSWIPRLGDVGVDLRILLLATAVSFLTAVLVGTAPAIRTTRSGLSSQLPQARGSSVGPSGGRLSRCIVVAEISLAVVLLVSSVLLVRGFLNLRTTDFGWDESGVLTFHVDLPQQGYQDNMRITSFFTEAVQKLASLPGVVSVGGTSLLPTKGDSHQVYDIVGEEPALLEERLVVRHRLILPGYFHTLRIRHLSGRRLDSRDGAQSEAVAIVNEVFSLRHWPGGDALNKQIRVGEEIYRIVGVVANTLDWDRRIEPTVYLSALQMPRASMRLVMQTLGPPASYGAQARATLAEIDPNLPIFLLQTMEEVMQEERVGESVMARLMSILAGVALFLSVVGIYGVIAYSVSRRTREIGIRMAVGATKNEVVRLVTIQGMSPAVFGMILGLVLAVVVARSLSAFLFGVSYWDPITFVGVAATMLAASILATSLPARHASRVDPIQTLRQE